MRSSLRTALFSGRQYQAESVTLFAAMSVAPSDARKADIDTMISTLKTAGIWPKMDMLYVLGAHDTQAARLNWIAPGTNTLTINGSVTFVTDRGATGDGTTGYLGTAKIHNTLAKCLQDDAHAGAWALTAGTSGRSVLGLDSSAILRVNINNGTTNERLVRINGANHQTNDDITTGHVVGVRRDAANSYSYRNGGSESTVASASSARSGTATITIGLSNTTLFCDQQIFLAHVGGQLSSAEVLTLYNAFNTYKTAVGA